MDFDFTRDQISFKESIERFARDVVAPRAAAIDESGAFPADVLKAAAGLGLLGVTIPAARGGAGRDYLSYVLAIEAIAPEVPHGNLPVKRLVGEPVAVTADIIADGHEMLAAELLWRADDEAGWHRVPMRLIANDRWEADFSPGRIGRHRFTVEAWWDLWGTFSHDLAAKHAAGQDVTLEVEEGLHMLRADTSPVKERIAPMSLENPNLAFIACGNTQANQAKAEGKPVALISEATVMPSGVVRLMELQKQGYAYIRP